MPRLPSMRPRYRGRNLFGAREDYRPQFCSKKQARAPRFCVSRHAHNIRRANPASDKRAHPRASRFAKTPSPIIEDAHAHPQGGHRGLKAQPAGSTP